MKLLQRVVAVTAIAGTVAFSASASAGLIWNEIGAGDLLGSAEVTFDSGPSTLSEIRGSLRSILPVNGGPGGGSLYEVDLYRIYIDSPATFSARTTINSVPADTALFLFDAAGLGVYMNDDTSSSSLAELPAGDPAAPAAPGIYYLGIGLGGFLPYDVLTGALFLAGGFTDVLAGDPAAGPLASWSPLFATFSESPYSYDIALTGAQVALIPEPGTLALLLLAGLVGGLRSRRRR
jgi:hypothetical protein